MSEKTLKWIVVILTLTAASLAILIWMQKTHRNASCQRALSEQSSWAERDRVSMERCEMLLEANLVPCTVRRFGPKTTGSGYFCALQTRNIVLAYDIKLGDHGELVRIGEFPVSQVTYE